MAESQIQILSDLHLESPPSYDQFSITPHAPHLALLGDIGWVKEPGLFDFFRRQLASFETVFFLLGNHEPYFSSWPRARAQLRSFEDEMNQQFQQGEIRGRFVFLDRARYDLSQSVTILGCTLHSNITSEQDHRVRYGTIDFYRILDWSVEGHREAHREDLAWLNEQVDSMSCSEPERKIVILTHHSPCLDRRAMDPRHARSAVSSAFVTDVSNEACWKSQSVKVWAFGHTHFNCDYEDKEAGKRFVTNQRGSHFGLSKGFDEGKVIRV
ncbi:hypothetical protein FQN50_002262 [Emmonsiellopsis sp. PD_5]|nr:hypothetical protein FQN50_002262 [Emmonsiellopsis sp. PD_5]